MKYFSLTNQDLVHILNLVMVGFKKGIRSRVEQKLGYKNFYLYSAAAPKTGDDFTLIMPTVNTDCMNVFLEQMSQWLEDRKALIIMESSWLA